MNTLRNKNNQTGFTLIELLVVIAIIGLLASVVLLALNGAREKSREAKRLADVRQFATALELYYNDFNSYPTLTLAATLVPTYIGSIPSAPTPADSPCAANNSYTYAGSTYNNIAQTYTLTFCLGGSGAGGYGYGPHTLTQGGIQ